MATTLTPNMSLPVPGVGTEAGPQYATDINNCLSIVDAHDHTPGSGVQITPSAMNINADLLLNGNNLTTARSIRLSSQSAALALSTDLGCLYEVGVDLYYNDGLGNQVRITQSGAVAGTPGSISNLVSPASASYSAGSKTFTWQSDALTPANLDAASIIVRNILPSSEGITISAPSPLAASYTMTLLSTPPASTLPVSMASSGALSAAQITLPQIATAVTQKFMTAPTIQAFTSGSGTYTTPTSPAPLYLRVRAVGAGGGGSGAIAAGSAGGTTTFGTSLITCTGGGGGGGGTPTGGANPAGGSATAVGLSGVVRDGAGGQGGGQGSYPSGGDGGVTPFGGAGAGGQGNSFGFSATANTGCGGGGGGGGNIGGFGSGAGGAAGGYVDVVIPSPSATYAYAIGAAGGAGAGGGNGGSGYIIVEEFYS